MKIGDLIRIKTLEPGRDYLRKYINKEFTILDMGQDEHLCMRGGMKYTMWFHESEIELVENKPKYSIGTLVEDKRYNGYLHVFPLGIVEQSNRLSSIVRFNIQHDCGEHISLFISNRNLRKVK